jgi:hypothetical protein
MCILNMLAVNIIVVSLYIVFGTESYKCFHYSDYECTTTDLGVLLVLLFSHFAFWTIIITECLLRRQRNAHQYEDVVEMI